MSNDEIKKEYDLQCHNIHLAEEKIKELRANCNHERTHEGLYSWRIGCIAPATMCSYCGQVIQISL